MLREKVSARGRLEQRGYYSKPANLLDYGIEAFADIPNDLPVVLSCRVSSDRQHQNDNLNDQDGWARIVIAKKGNPLKSIWREIASGYALDAGDRLAFEFAIADAKRYGAVLVFESISRLVRNIFYHPSKTPDAMPTEFEMKRVMELLDGVQVATLCPPNATPSEIRSYETIRGQYMKGNKGGCPKKPKPGDKKKCRLENLPIAIQLNGAGFSLREIGRKLGIAHSTVADWLNMTK